MPAWAYGLPDDQALAVRLAFRSILKGQPLPLRGSGLNLGTLVEDGRVLLDDGGEHVVMAAGLSLLPTRHRLLLDGRQLYTSCAFDTVGIPAALNRPARVDSACQVCARLLTFDFPADHADREARLWIAEKQVGDSFVRDT